MNNVIVFPHKYFSADFCTFCACSLLFKIKPRENVLNARAVTKRPVYTLSVRCVGRFSAFLAVSVDFRPPKHSRGLKNSTFFSKNSRYVWKSFVLKVGVVLTYMKSPYV